MDNKMYTAAQVLAYASTMLKPGLSTDTKDSIEENQRLQVFIGCFTLNDSSGIDKFLESEKSKKLIKRYTEQPY